MARERETFQKALVDFFTRKHPDNSEIFDMLSLNFSISMDIGKSRLAAAKRLMQKPLAVGNLEPIELILQVRAP